VLTRSILSHEETSRTNTDSASQLGTSGVAGGKLWVVRVLAVLVLLAMAAGWWLYRPAQTATTATPGAAGASAATQDSTVVASAPDARPGRLSSEQLERMVAQTAERVAQAPSDASALAMLAHSQEMLGRFDEATKTYRKLAELMPKDAQILADYADAMGVANGRSLQGEPEVLLGRALAVDPQNIKALMLTGSLAMERGDTQKALSNWNKARAHATQPELVKKIDAQIASVTGGAAPGMVREPATLVQNLTGGAPSALSGQAKVAGRVWVARDLMGVVSPDAVVYIMVRPADGASRMPVALLRKRVKELPASFVLDDSNAMVKGASLAELQSVVVVARVSTRGDVTPKAGDLQGVSLPVPVGATGIKLEINEVLK
jgi:cytochrome c-type biogenesis protein CcmH